MLHQTGKGDVMALGIGEGIAISSVCGVIIAAIIKTKVISENDKYFTKVVAENDKYVSKEICEVKYRGIEKELASLNLWMEKVDKKVDIINKTVNQLAEQN